MARRSSIAKNVGSSTDQDHKVEPAANAFLRGRSLAIANIALQRITGTIKRNTCCICPCVGAAAALPRCRPDGPRRPAVSIGRLAAQLAAHTPGILWAKGLIG